MNGGSKFVDLFCGTTAVAQHFKKKGYTVIANDFLEFSYALAKTYIELNEEPKFLKLKKFLDITNIDKNYVIGYLNNLKLKAGFIFENYCPNGKGGRKYFSDENGKKLTQLEKRSKNGKQKNALMNSSIIIW